MSGSKEGGNRAADIASDAPVPSARAPSVPDPLIGRVISGRFKIVSLIARGGMGKVYKAEQAPLGRICALKVLNPSYEGEGDPEFHRRFFLEASTASKLTHPNTITIFDYGKADDEDLYYIAMEYIEGKTLYRALREEGPFSEARVGLIARQICRSLREAHRLGVVHRDLKPANVLLSNHEDEHDRVKVLDFGLVKDVSGASEDLTQTGLFMGSPKYMSPEQITGTPVTAGTDIYSLGVLLFEMLTGKVPFDKAKNVMTLMAHVNEAPAALGDVLPGITVSPQMEALVYRCLEKEPERRFASMDEVLGALKNAGAASGLWTSDTNEGLPAAHIDPMYSRHPSMTPPGISGVGRVSVSPSPSQHPSRSGPLLPSSSAALAGARDPAPPDTGVMSRQSTARAPRWGVPFGIAIALAAGLSAFVVLTRRAPTPTSMNDSASAVAAAPTTAPSAIPATSASTNVASASRVVMVDTDPDGATVSENGAKLCSPTPCNVIFKDADTHKVQLDMQGFKTVSVTIQANDTKVSPKLDSTKTTAAAAAVRPVSPPPPAKTGKVDDFKPSPY